MRSLPLAAALWVGLGVASGIAWGAGVPGASPRGPAAEPEARTAAAENQDQDKKETPEPTKAKKKKRFSLWNRWRSVEPAEPGEKETRKKEEAEPPARAQERTPPEPAPPAPQPLRTPEPPPKPEKARPKAVPPRERSPRPAPALAAPPQPAPAHPGRPSGSLARAVTEIRASALSKDPSVGARLEAIERGEASLEQLNDFAVEIGRRGYTATALLVQEEVVRRAPKNPLFWLNLGTLHRDAGKLDLAERDYRRVVALDPNHALAHYNLGAIREARLDYDGAIAFYKKALRLDPGLADPRHNPQVVNTQLMLAVQLQLYQEQAGALGLPLLSAGKGEPGPEKNKPGPADESRQP